MKKLLATLSFLLLAACQDAPGGFNPEPLSFTSPPLRVNVAEVRVVENYQSPMRAPNIEHELHLSPAAAVRQWAKQRVYAVGGTGVLEITIDDASVKETKLQKTDGIKGLFTDDQDSRYDARLNVTIRLYDGAESISAATSDVTVTQARSVNEKATLETRQKLWDSMVKSLMVSYDAQASLRMRQYFSAYLR